MLLREQNQDNNQKEEAVLIKIVSSKLMNIIQNNVNRPPVYDIFFTLQGQ